MDPNFDHIAAWTPPSLQEVLPKIATIGPLEYICKIQQIECGNKMSKKIILSLVFAIVGYFLGIVADATHDTELAIYPAACGLKDRRSVELI